MAKQYKLSGNAQIEHTRSSFGFIEILAYIANITGNKYITLKEVKTSGSTREWVYGLLNKIKLQNSKLPIDPTAPISLKNLTA